MKQLYEYQLNKLHEELLLVLEDIPYRYDLKYSKLEQINELIQSFISSLDARQSSRNTYYRTLKQYFSWIDYKGYYLSQIVRSQIVEYKTDLLGSGLSALTVGSYITSVRRFYEWCEPEKIYLNVAKGVKVRKDKTSSGDMD